MKRVALAVALIAILFASVASAQYSTTIVREQGGNKLTVLSGGEIEVQSGATVDLQAGAIFTATGFITDTHVNASAAIARTKLAVDAAKLVGTSIFELRQPLGIPLVSAETAGSFNVDVSGNVMLAKGEITDNETEVSVTQLQVALPPEYVAGAPVSIRISCALVKTGAAVDNGSTIDVSAYWQLGGAVSADLVSTAAQTFAAVDQWYTKVFVVDPTNLQPGYLLNIVITSSVIDSEAGAGTLRMSLEAPALSLSIQG
jgi:hypothetical protein